LALREGTGKRANLKGVDLDKPLQFRWVKANQVKIVWRSASKTFKKEGCTREGNGKKGQKPGGGSQGKRGGGTGGHRGRRKVMNGIGVKKVARRTENKAAMSVW